MAYILITNNAKVNEKYSAKSDRHLASINYLPEADLIQILTIVRDRVHQGHELLTHPLTGSIKPYETPFKSICISAEKGPVQMMSVMIIEEAINTAKKFLKDQRTVVYPDSVLEDFQTIDLSLIDSGIESICTMG